MPRRLRVIAVDRACVRDQDCWPELFAECPRVPPPNGHIRDQTGAPIVAGFSAPATDSAPKSKLQSADRPAALPPDNKNRIAPEHQPRCTECDGTAPRQIRTHSDRAKRWPRQPERHCLDPTKRNRALRERFGQLGPTRARLRSLYARRHESWLRSTTAHGFWARRLVPHRRRALGGHPV